MAMSHIPQPFIRICQRNKTLHSINLETGREYVIGRIPQADIVVQHPSVSRMHAKIYVRDDGVYLEDLGSANGTFLNGERVQGVVKLSDGAVIQTGQRTVAEPIVLIFEDPAARLLREMGIQEEAVPAEADMTPGAEAPEETPIAEPVAGEEEEGTKETGETAAASSREGTVADTRPLPLWKRPAIIAMGVMALILFISVVVILVRFLKPTATHWKSVQISPVEIHAGDRLVLDSPEILSGAKYQVILNGVTVKEVRTQRNRLIVDVPDLGLEQAGRHDVVITVKKGDIETFSGMLKYVVSPKIEAVEPVRTHVGERVTIRGHGFTNDPARLEVKFNHLPASVLETSPTRIVVQVPAITRDKPVSAYIRIEIDPWVTSSSTPVEVGPRIPRPVPFKFTASWEEAHQLWEVSHPFGPAFLVGGPSPGGPGIPRVVLSLVDTMNQWYAMMVKDRSLYFDIQAQGHRYRLIVRGKRNRLKDVICEWTPDQLRAMADAMETKVIPELLPYWVAGTLNQFIQVFARGEAIEASEGVPPFVRALNRLVEMNKKGGGGGRPDEVDLEALTPEDRRSLATAWSQIPAGYGNVTGTWEGEIENVFFTISKMKIFVTFSIQQKGTVLSGQSVVRYESPGLQGSLPPANLRGELIPGAPLRVRIRATYKKPIGRLTFEGVIYGSEIRGTFKHRGSGVGQWSVRRK